MKKHLLGLLLLAAALLSPVDVRAACGGDCFWIGGTGTLNLTSDSAHWSSSSGGTTCSCEPGTTDNINFDANSGGGTVTVSVGGTWTAAALLMATFTGTLDFQGANNTSFTTAGVVDSNGSAGFNLGGGTWTLSGANAYFRIGSANTFNANGSTISFTAAGGAGTFRRLFPGGKSFNIINIAANANGMFIFTAATTVATLTAAAPNKIILPGGANLTVTNATNLTGSSGNVITFAGDGLSAGGTGAAGYVSANNFTCTWCAIGLVNFSGGGTFTAPNSFDLGGNGGTITITPPASGGGGGGRIIGG